MADDTQIILVRDNIKRSIKFPFDMCLSRAAAMVLIEKLQAEVADGLIYGWVRISDEFVESEPSTKPKEWTD